MTNKYRGIRKKILEYLKANGPTKSKVLIRELGYNCYAIHTNLYSTKRQGFIRKIRLDNGFHYECTDKIPSYGNHMEKRKPKAAKTANITPPSYRQQRLREMLSNMPSMPMPKRAVFMTSFRKNG